MKYRDEANTVPVPNKHPRDTDQNVINNNLISLYNNNISEVQLTVVCFSKYQVLFYRSSLMFKNSTRKMLLFSWRQRYGSTPQRCVMSTPRLNSESGRFGFQLNCLISKTVLFGWHLTLNFQWLPHPRFSHSVFSEHLLCLKNYASFSKEHVTLPHRTYLIGSYHLGGEGGKNIDTNITVTNARPYMLFLPGQSWIFPVILGNSTPFHSQMCPGLGDKLYDYWSRCWQCPSIFSLSYPLSVYHLIFNFQHLHFFHLEFSLATDLANGPEVLGSY